MDRARSYDAVIVGGGVIGLCCAWRAAQRGLRVAVVDPTPGRGASNVAAGMLAPVTELHYGEESLLRLNLAAAQRYPSFVAEVEESSALPAGYRACGTLAVALDGGDRAALEELSRFQRSLGLNVETLSGRECRRLEPMLSPGVRGGVLVAGDHQVDNRLLTAALLEAAVRAGVEVVRSQAASVVVVYDAATGVRLAGAGSEATLRADVVVLAAGCRSGSIAGIPDEVRPPVRPVKGQILRLQVPPAYAPFLSRTVRGTVHGFPVYLVPRTDGELVVGATVEELGWDEQVTAGGVYALLRDAHALVPGLTELPMAETTAGLRPGSPDNAPMVGPTALPGMVVATGHHRNGILLAPTTADAVAELLVTGSLPALMEPFTPRRFDSEGVLA
jgi:glycine oxidase